MVSLSSFWDEEDLVGCDVENTAIADGHGMDGAVKFHAADEGVSHCEGVDPVGAVKAAFGDENFEDVLFFPGGGVDCFRANGHPYRVAVAG